MARSDGYPTWRDLRMNLERQLDDVNTVSHEHCRSMLADVAERAQEIVPGQHNRSVTTCASGNRIAFAVSTIQLLP